MAKRTGISKTISVLAAACLFCAIIAMFFPLVGIKTAEGEPILFTGIVIIFGGKVELIYTSGVYSFHFDVNIPLLVAMQGLLLSAVACMLGNESFVNRFFSLILGLASLIALFFTRYFVASFSSLELQGMTFHIGLLATIVLALMGVALQIFGIVHARRQRRG